MRNEIALLDASLLVNKAVLDELTHWLRVFQRPNGWHYDLDHIWILNELERSGVQPGATILDAGAGQGIMQYVLASRGYHVISLDFSLREKPRRSIGIFYIEGSGSSQIAYNHPYMRFISYGDAVRWPNVESSVSWGLEKLSSMPRRIVEYTRSLKALIYERYFKNNKGYGKIQYVRAPFHEVPLQSDSVDAVISVSAIEHADIELFGENIEELRRLLKPGGSFLLTTSATTFDENQFHEKSSGWCFSLPFLSKYFPECDVSFDVGDCVRSIKESKIFRSRLDPYYYQDRESFCFRKRLEELPYLPVGIKTTK